MTQSINKMKRIKMKPVFIVLILGILSVGAFYTSKILSITNDIPETFRFEGEPINAFCIDRIVFGDSSRFRIIKISECTALSKKYETWKDERYDAFKDFIGFHYKSKEDESNSGYVYYKYLGSFKGEHIVFSQVNGGGSGHFSNITFVKLDSNQGTIQNIDEINGGDRCNGGIDAKSVNFKNNKIIYSQNITPQGFVNKALGYDSSGFHAPLYDCAICCVATAEMEVDLNKSKEPQLKSITLNNESDLGEMLNTADNEVGKCFNKLIKEFLKDGKKILNQSDLDKFSQSFKGCYKKK